MHVEPPPILLIKSKNDTKSGKYCVKIKLRRDHTLEQSGLYYFKMDLFDNVKTEEFLLLVQNFKNTLKASVMLDASAKIQYLCMLISGEALHQLDMLSVKLVSTTIEHLNHIILGLGTYFFLLMRC